MGLISLCSFGTKKPGRSLGIQKICVLIDSPADVNEIPNENTVKKAIEDKFSTNPNIKVIQWDKNDIRDKPKLVKLPAVKVGYFTDKGILKNESELGDFHEKIKQIKAHFQVSEINKIIEENANKVMKPFEE